jgi:N-methylhydantoinase B
VATRVRNLLEGRWNLRSNGREKMPPWGLWGGKSGVPSDQLLKLPEDEDFQHIDRNPVLVPPGSVVIFMTAGGGGWGDPLERDPKRVKNDVIEGYVSLEAAKQQYGVVLEPETLEIEFELTERYRAELRQGNQ